MQISSELEAATPGRVSIDSTTSSSLSPHRRVEEIVTRTKEHGAGDKYQKGLERYGVPAAVYDEEIKQDDLDFTPMPFKFTKRRPPSSQLEETRPFDEAHDEEADPPSLSPRTFSKRAVVKSRESPVPSYNNARPISPGSSAYRSPRQSRALAARDTMHLPDDSLSMPPMRISPPARTLRNATSASVLLQDNRETILQEKYKNISARDPPEEEDSVFDFQDRPRRYAKAQSRAREIEPDAEDESFLHTPTLSQRTRDAWERKNSRKTAVALESSPSSVRSGASVSFDKEPDTVQYYEPDDTNDHTTLADRSLESEYTKSVESEVEDLIKDIFFLGGDGPTNPGRRKIKYSPAMRERIRARRSEADDDDVTDATQEEPQLQAKLRRQPQSRGSGDKRRNYDTSDGEDDDNPLAEVWNYMEGGIKSVSELLGIHGVQASDRFKSMGGARRSDGELENFWLMMVEKSRACTSGSLAALDDTTTPMSRDASPRSRDASSRAVPTAVSLEDDMRLVDLSTQAARSLHRLRGFEYDESYQISIADDIVFAVVDLVAPFGIIFQENPVGCWVTKVLPQGSAARSNKVQVGDQLAAIDGMSAINMKVDEMSALVTQKKGVVELTFLRFVGPLRPAPGPIQEEGYEVKSQKGTQPSLTRYAQPISQGKAAFVSSQRPEAPASPKERRGFRLFKLGRSRKYNL